VKPESRRFAGHYVWLDIVRFTLDKELVAHLSGPRCSPARFRPEPSLSQVRPAVPLFLAWNHWDRRQCKSLRFPRDSSMIFCIIFGHNPLDIPVFQVLYFLFLRKSSFWYG